MIIHHELIKTLAPHPLLHFMIVPFFSVRQKWIVTFFFFFSFFLLISSNEYVKVFSKNQEFVRYSGCSLERGYLVVAPFRQSNNIITEIGIQNMGSYMMTTFVVLKGGLDSGLWRIERLNF